MAWLQGAIVVRHEISFADRMTSTQDPWIVQNMTNHLMASYARLDVPIIMEKVCTHCIAGWLVHGVQPSTVHTLTAPVYCSRIDV